MRNTQGINILNFIKNNVDGGFWFWDLIRLNIYCVFRLYVVVAAVFVCVLFCYLMAK